MVKRDREDVVTLEDGRAAAKRIFCVPPWDLLDEGKSTDLPYLGIGHPSGRPPVQLSYIGCSFVLDIVSAFMTERRKAVVLGPKGVGKSSDARAACVMIYGSLAHEQKNELIVGIWNMPDALDDLPRVLQNALLFAYIVKREGDLLAKQPQGGTGDGATGGEDDSERPESSNRAEVGGKGDAAKSSNSRENDEMRQLEEEIRQLESVTAVKEFIFRRKQQYNEEFHFVADGWEVTDAVDSDGRPVSHHNKRILVQQQLDHLLTEFSTILYISSSKSEIAKGRGRKPDTTFLQKFKPFTDKQYSVFADRTLLGKLSTRGDDILYYTGRVPWLLEILADCCRPTLSTAELVQALKPKCSFSIGKFVDAKKEAILKDEEIANSLCTDDDEWASVLMKFRAHDDINAIESRVDGLELKEGKLYYSFEDMGREDSTFFNVQERCYISEYISTLYIKGFRRREEEARRHARGIWMP